MTVAMATMRPPMAPPHSHAPPPSGSAATWFQANSPVIDRITSIRPVLLMVPLTDMVLPSSTTPTRPLPASRKTFSLRAGLLLRMRHSR